LGKGFLKIFYELVVVKKCPKCGHTLDEDANFCSNCGYALKGPDKCPHCGADLPPGAKFCTKCGEKVE